MRSCCVALLYGALYLAWYWYCEGTALWSRLYEVDYECEHPALPANQSGVKVMVAGFAKTGTRTMSRVLYQLGLEHSYHSEDFNMFVWARLADKFWLQRSGGSWSGLPNPVSTPTGDAEVLNGTSSVELAAAVSRCRVDAIAFDGIEKLFWPIYAVSPDTKVVLMNWRTFAEWRKSLEEFAPLLALEILTMGCLDSAVSIFPWAALFHVIEPLAGRRIEKLLRSGGPPICQVYDTYTSYWHSTSNFRRIVQRWISGISFFPETEQDYYKYLQAVKEAVPPENLFEWDMRKHKYEDLCGFLGIDPCPKSGRLPRVNNCFIFQRDFPWISFTRAPVILLLHWVNWKILSTVFSAAARLVRGKPKAQ